MDLVPFRRVIAAHNLHQHSNGHPIFHPHSMFLNENEFSVSTSDELPSSTGPFVRASELSQPQSNTDGGVSNQEDSSMEVCRAVHEVADTDRLSALRLRLDRLLKGTKRRRGSALLMPSSKDSEGSGLQRVAVRR